MRNWWHSRNQDQRTLFGVLGFFVFMAALVGALAGSGLGDGPPTAVVSPSQLLSYRGVNCHGGNRLASAELISTSKLHGKTTLIAGFGGGSVSGSSDVGLLLQIFSGSQIQPLVVHSWTVSIRPGPPKVTYVVNKPYSELYYRLLSKPVTDDHDGVDKKGYHSMTAQQLVENFVQGARLQMDQETFNKVFGGTS